MSSETDQPFRFGPLLRSMAFVGMSFHFGARLAPGSIWLMLLFGVLIIGSLIYFIACLCTIPPRIQ